MNAHRIETKIGANNTVLLKELPFEEGETVEVIILEKKIRLKRDNTNQLRGKVLKYDEPFEPIARDDWEVLK